MKKFTFAALAMGLLLTGCAGGTTTYAPVTDLVHQPEPLPKSGSHQVKKGETLYEIAWRYGLDYRDVMQANHLNNVHTLQPGQRISLQKTQIAAKQQQLSLHPNNISQMAETRLRWHFPARGKVVAGYSTFNKGINIAGAYGSPIYAAAPGIVVYAGNGLRGYGNLIIIKHNNTYLSAYAHNSVLLVHEGQKVTGGEKIALMGALGIKNAGLHFEIRRAGEPIDPMRLL